MLISRILFLGAAAIVAASPPTERSFLGVGKRSTASNGGFALQSTDCPVGASLCQSHWCCPNTLTCSVTNDTTVDNVCCNGTDDCYNALVAAPVCADSSWGLFLATTTASFNGDPNVPTTAGQFCCLPGQIGTSNGECVSDPGSVPPNQSASSIVPGTASKSTASSAAHTAAGTGTSTQSPGTATTANTGSSSTVTVVGVPKSKGSSTNTVSLSLFAFLTVTAIFAAIFA